MKFDRGESCPYGGMYTLQIDMKCDQLVPNTMAKFTLLSNVSSCNIHLMTEAEAACPIFSLGWMIDQYFFIFTLVFLIGGTCMTFYGLRFFTSVLFLFGALAIGTLILVLIYEILLPINSPKWAFWVTLIFAYAIGVAAGFYIVRYQRYCFILIGAYLGTMLSLFLFNLFLYKFLPENYLMSFMIISTIGCAIVNFFYKEVVTILSTSITGAYMAVRGLSFILGGYPSEVFIYDILKKQQLDKIPWTLHAYLSLILFMSVIGICVQFNEKTEKEKDIFTYSHPYQPMYDAIS